MSSIETPAEPKTCVSVALLATVLMLDNIVGNTLINTTKPTTPKTMAKTTFFIEIVPSSFLDNPDFSIT